MAKKVFGILRAEDLYRMVRHPEHDYILQTDIDLQGAFWNPPAAFVSRLNGNGKTIRNARIGCSAQGCLGFFSTVTEEGAVWDLTLEDMQIVCDDSVQYAGGIAGVNRGSLENITITGTLFDSSREDSVVGAAVGHNYGTVRNVRSELHITVPEGKPLALVGKNEPEGEAQGLWRDHRYSDRPLSPESIAMRQTAISHSYRMGTQVWHVPAPLKFISPYIASASQTFMPGETYYGLPYTNKYGSYERFMYCLDEQNTVKPWVMEMGDGFDGFDRFMGADCSGNIYWSWARVCSSISFAATVHMVPVPENIDEYGVLPVGDYCAEPDGEGRPFTMRILDANGEDKILECLAQARYGDAIVNFLPEGGHTKLLVADSWIYRDENGRIDREESKMFTNELGGTGPELNSGYSKWSLNRKNKFAVLMRQGYVPITNRELQEGKRTPVELKVDVTGLAEGTVESNYRIISTRVILEQNGGEVCSSLRFTAVAPTAPGNNEDAARTTVRKVDLSCHKEDLETLPAGSYNCRVEVLLSTGKTYTVWNQQVER